MTELRAIQGRFEQVRRRLQQAQTNLEPPHRVITEVAEQVRSVLGHVQAHRDLFPLMGEIADTMMTFVDASEKLADQISQVPGELYNAGLRTPVPESPAAGAGLSSSPDQPPGEADVPNGGGDPNR